MREEKEALRNAVATQSLHEAHQLIIYELRESIFPALTAIQILKEKGLGGEKRDELLAFAEAHLSRAVDDIKMLMVDIFLQRLRSNSTDDTNPS